MNWERLFYWLTIADNVHVILVIVTTIFGTGFLVFGGLWTSAYMSDKQHFKKLRKYTLFCAVLFAFAGSVTLLTPDEDDVMLMISGTAVSSVLDTTNTYDDLPDEVADLLRSQIIEELKYTKRKTREYLEILTIEDTLKYVPREELYEIITVLSKPYGVVPSFTD